MVKYIPAFIAGVVALQFCSELPAWYWYAAGTALMVLLLLHPRSRVLAPAVFGFFWAALQAEFALQPALEEYLEGQTLLVDGVVGDIPRQLAEQDIRFPLNVTRLHVGAGWRGFDGKVRLSWYRSSQQPRAGERWQFAVRLKRPHGFSNPGGFDYERWLFQQRYRATGYVREDTRNRRLGTGRLTGIGPMRSRIAVVFQSMRNDLPTLGLVRALTIGDRSAISHSHWEILRRTGTSHLMAISGLHISLVAGLVFWLARTIWSRTGRLAEMIPAYKAAAVVAIAAAAIYALLAGFNIPTQRALIMVCVLMTALLLDCRASLMCSLGVAAGIILLADPLSVLSAGWWLSFWAVATIAYLVSGRIGKQGFWQKWGYVHIVLAVSMLPILLTFFQQASLIAPLANSMAVPWITMLVVPLSLAGTLVLFVHEGAGTMLLELAARLVDVVWPLLEWLAGFKSALWQQHQPLAWTLGPALAGLAVLLAPRGIPGRWTGGLMLLPLLLVKPPGPEPGAVWLTLLDVGQGLATVVRTQHHTLVYDAGPRFSPVFDTGSAVVMPFLRHQGIPRIDKLLVSHGDNDHIGGVRSLLQEYPVSEVISGAPQKVLWAPATRCRRGDQWQWDGVEFLLLHPDSGAEATGNNASCVMRIETANGKAILLTGDIEATVERALLHKQKEHLPAEVLVVPHHGSLTSSTPAFVQAVQPAVALFPAGWNNRYRFPRPGIIARYQACGAQLYETGRHGAITLKWHPDSSQAVILPYRAMRRRYWQASE